MKLLTEDWEDYLEDEISVVDRGILVTIKILEKNTSQRTLKDVKPYIDFTKYRDNLIHLHQVGCIEWSGYRKAVRSKKKKAEGDNPEIEQALKFMSDLYKEDFNATKQNSKHLKSRLKEVGLEDVKKVIANRYSEWSGTKMEKYLRPQTIFRPTKFEMYLQEANRTRQGEGFVNAQKVGLKDGDEITYKLSQTLVDKDVYRILIYVAKNDKKIGSGREEKMYGKDIRLSLKRSQNSIKRGNKKELIYIYQNI